MLADEFNGFFDTKISKLKAGIETAAQNVMPPSDISTPINCSLQSFDAVSTEHIGKIILDSKSATCDLDPLPTWILKKDLIVDTISPLITYIFNSSISSSCVPESLKYALVTPILKKSSLDQQIFKNYRPVSKLPFLEKVLEKVISCQIRDYLVKNNLHDPLQSAYKHGHSTETALLKIKTDIDLALDKNHGVNLVLLDLSAAFDTVSHDILFKRLENIGIKGSALDWITSYLSNRIQQVQINGIVSKPKPISARFSTWTFVVPDICSSFRIAN
ncbi:hypothetical protein SNE40_021026 [Patella caerulea]|uniref:Reverse transcriptase domain-containing protein n=1 Tax=Patella caerulea TaxID=87958 RepID=A0AAN8IXT9_PATCE